MTAKANELIEVFVRDPLGTNRFGPELVSNQKRLIEFNGHQLSIDDAVKQCNIQEHVLSEIYLLIEAVSKAEPQMLLGKKMFFKNFIDRLTGGDILRKTQFEIYSKVVNKLTGRIPDLIDSLSTTAYITKGLETIYSDDIIQLESFIASVEEYLIKSSGLEMDISSNEYMACNRLSIRVKNLQGVLVGLKMSKIQAQLSYQTVIDVKDSLCDIKDTLIPMWENQVKSINTESITSGISNDAQKKFKNLVNKLNKNIKVK